RTAVAVAQVVDTRCPPVLGDHAGCKRVGLDRQVGTRRGRPEIPFGCARTAALVDIEVRGAETLLAWTMKILQVQESELLCRRNQAGIDVVVGLVPGGGERPVSPVKLTCPPPATL